MPLAFHSTSHGGIAFGFFNIDTDLLLLEHYFIFAPEFCRNIASLVDSRTTPAHHTPWEVYDIRDRRAIGDLMGAIHGIHYAGFIGEVYKRFPFPKDPAGFKQKPEGFRNRSRVQPLIERVAEKIEIPFEWNPRRKTVLIGEYRFTGAVFRELIQYVWLGGYPRWRDGTRPDYVLDMKRTIQENPHPLFEGLTFPP